LDLMSNRLEPVNRSELKVGYMYYHFNRRLNRWAWSYWQADGGFWSAFGEGSTQEGWRFDIRATQEQIQERLNDFPQLRDFMRQYGQAACLKLQADGRWKIAGVGFPPSIFNAETGELWQAQGEKYIPVIHTGGSLWTFRNGRYYPGGMTGCCP
jgi:hypothetical protein